jgi:type IV fimbrial biogenesis protein FimT
MRNSARGFTLIELMVTVVVLAILLAIGVPSFREFYLNNRITSQINMLHSHLLLARSEAVKRNRPAQVCGIAPGSQLCADRDWSQGWVVFVDRDGDGIPSLDSPAGCAQQSLAEAQKGDDCILATTGPLEGDLRLTAGTGINGMLSFSGFGNARCREGFLDECYFTLCDSRGPEKALALVVGRTGHAQTSRTSPDTEKLTCPK